MRCLLLLLLLTATATASPRLELSGNSCDMSSMTIDAPTDALVHVEVITDGDQVAATITFDDGRNRDVHAASCAQLAESVALIIEMALSEPTRQVHAPASLADGLGVTASYAVPTSGGFDVVAAAAGAWSSHGWQQQFSLGTRWKRDARSFGVELRVVAPDREPIGASAQIAVWTAAVSVSPCLHRGGLAGCVTATAGTVEGTGRGLAELDRAFTPLLEGGVRLTWEHALSGPYALRLQIDAEAALTTTRFDVDHMVVWTSDRVTIWGGAGVISHFP
jgi:hypothetical protein